MTFRILYFASAAAYTKKSFDLLESPMLLSELFDTLERMYPGIKEKVLKSCLVTIDLEYADLHGEKRVLAEGMEVAIIPPVSSG